MTCLASTENSGRRYLPAYFSPEAESPNQQLLPLSARGNDQDHLEVGGCDVPDLVERFGSPLYIVDELTLRTACRQYLSAWKRFYPGPAQVLFASKAWSCLALCALVAREGLGVDVVSGGELYTALAAGVDPGRIYLHGNNKSRLELEQGIESGVTIVVDNWLELETLASLGRQVTIFLRLTPGIECHTHQYIRTGHLDSKFGFDLQQLSEVCQFIRQHSHLYCRGLHAHIGSQIFELQPHQDLGEVMVQALVATREAGLPVEALNLGGGLGISYTETDDPPSIGAWVEQVAQGVIEACGRRGIPLPELLCEPGRSLVGPAGITAYRVGSRKEVPGVRTYLSVDGGMSDNPRPITYQSTYRALMANCLSAPLTQVVTVAGKHCESGDVLIAQAQLPPAVAGDILVVAGTGAYNYSMASNYNRICRPAAVLVYAGDASLILRRETYLDLVRQDLLPPHLAF